MIIGIAGPAGSGKSTAAEMLVSFAGFTRHPFAGPLKEMMRCLGLSDHEIFDPVGKEQPSTILGGQTPRWAMQTLGTEWGRDLITPDLWINAWQARLPAGDVVADDVRFDNEVETIHRHGGVVIGIDRPGHDYASSHSSEKGVETDAQVVNDGSPADLLRRIVQISGGYRSRHIA